MKKLLIEIVFIGIGSMFEILGNEIAHVKNDFFIKKEAMETYDNRKEAFFFDLMTTDNVETMEKVFKHSLVDAQSSFCAHLFCMIQSEEMGDLFVKYGFDIHKKRRRHKIATLLHQGSFSGVLTPIAIQYALENGVDVDAKVKNGMTALCLQFLFCEQDFFVENVKTLLEHGASVDTIIDQEKNTPLHILCKKRVKVYDFLSYYDYKNNLIKAAIFLIRCGANPCALNKDGYEPWELVDCNDTLKVYLEQEAQGARTMQLLDL